MFLNSTFGKSMVAGKVVGAAQKHFNVGAAKEVYFSFLPIEEQESIVEQADRMRANTRRLASSFAEKLSIIADLRQSLLQRAFAGRLT